MESTSDEMETNLDGINSTKDWIMTIVVDMKSIARCNDTPFELDTYRKHVFTVSVHIGTIPAKIITI